ncbi:MAG: hypothetical protein PSY12_09685 [bacterium]|nr:hypothetical protein [bacterium]
MYPSSELCRAQEQAQMDRASGTTLANVRRIAEMAALMWRKEGASALKREKRALLSQSQRSGPDVEFMNMHFNEHPDRGLSAD